MATGLNSIMRMGMGALFASQANLQITGNNMANVNTQGYSRQMVMLQANTAIDYSPGQIGQGVSATQVVRHFDKFVESAYLDRNTMSSRYATEYQMMRSVESLFNEASETPGIGSALSDFFTSWTKLSQEPDSLAARTALLEYARTLASTVRNVENSMQQMQDEMNVRISQEVESANTLIQEIAALNREINIHTIEGRNNANSLLDLRDEKVRQLSTILDIKVEDRGAGDYNVLTAWGDPLVQGDIPFSLSVLGPRVDNNLVHNSEYKGTVAFDGSDGCEYTVEVVYGGTVDRTGAVPPPLGTAQYKVSLDGGKTWLMDEATGQPKLFYATDAAHSNKVHNLDISFTDTSSSLTAGDKFVISPKQDVYWNSPTSGPKNISSQSYKNGIQNGQRITGGTLGAALDFRDTKLTEYRDRIAELTDAIVWEVNRLHSQGAGLEPLTSVLGGYMVGRTDVPLGSPSSGFHWADKLQAGNMSFSIYDPATGEPLTLNGAVLGFDVFSPENFDPNKHSLQDVVNAINSGPASPYMQASIVDGRLQLTGKETAPGSGQYYSFGICSDSSGLAAALGINTFFTGDSPGSLAVREDLINNPNLINAGRVNGGAEGNEGDNITAKEIGALIGKVISIGGTQQSMTDYYAATVTKVGAETQSTRYMAITETTMANELQARKDEISGVSLDEEMTNLIKFQSSYKAAAKLITTADEMMQVLLSLKS